MLTVTPHVAPNVVKVHIAGSVTQFKEVVANVAKEHLALVDSVANQ